MMKSVRTSGAICLISFLVAVGAISLPAQEVEDGFRSIFNGKSLDGWEGAEGFWSVKDGAITGQTTAETKLKKNSFLIWRHGKLDDFELRLSYRIVAGNSGIQYRSRDEGDYVVGGYQADFEAGDTYSGILYEERGRGILALRGTKVRIDENGKNIVVGSHGDTKEIQAAIKKEDWNDYVIAARGNHLIHKINGRITAEVIDDQASKRAMDGILAFQIHVGPPMIVQFKNVRIKRLPLEGRKKIVLVAGRPSHAPGDHEHNAGMQLLAKCINQQEGYYATFYLNGWPKDPSAFDNADSIGLYMDGGGGHPVSRHIDELDVFMKKGVGLFCLHYAVEVLKNKPGNALLDWIGGYFETFWSINPHWMLENPILASDHPITRGVKPFTANDEWYYHMRFRKDMKGVTPILSGIPPDSTRFDRGLGAHAGNEHVRARKGMAEVLAWAATRPDGGRGFGFTGAHYHRNWKIEDFRKLVLNAIIWTAGGEVPVSGVVSKLSDEDYEANLDPKGRRRPREKNKKKVKPAGKKQFQSKPIGKGTVNVDVNIRGAKKLFLVVGDAGDGFGCDWADWIEPRIEGPKGTKKLTEIRWTTASSGWGQPRVDKNAGGGALRVDGRDISYGIGTHADSVIEFDLPAGYETFKAKGGLDNGGSDQGCGSTVQFMVFTKKAQIAKRLRSPRKSGGRSPDVALAGLEVHEALEVELFAHEPMVVNPTNLDIDARGRVWVTEGVNYRRWKSNEKAGDRIVILEDTSGDGKADKSTVYYQDPSINAALGICVLGNRVIVACSPNIFVFTDENGDDRPDKKELLFTGIQGVQHDHGAHAFVFGPDGKLYFNFGNNGRNLKDAKGQIITDLAGNRVTADGRPYRMGMVFRCNLDGSEVETLGHNFRNNYEVAVDSFGTLWQSDNDDDGNRGVRINYVMEYGNYGFSDEITGAGWRTPRTGMDKLPRQHWHQNDPGVVPNFVHTGAGSPTGICVYEGKLLPQIFRNQVIHCDAGPNVVRAYPAKKDGAGYKGEIVDVVKGTDPWFRPSDVCVDADGSLFVSDWYDSGVGGHNMGDNVPGSMRGRIFRVAPKGNKRSIPAFDVSSVSGAIAQIQSPNQARRYLAWQSLHSRGAAAEEELRKLFGAKDARIRSRALHLLAQIPGRTAHYVEAGLRAANSDLRVAAIRIAREREMDVLPMVRAMAGDASPQVLRECAIALRGNRSAEAAALWAELAARHDGKDRWYLEALGIGAAGQEEAFFRAWLSRVDNRWNTAAGRDIVWRSRAPSSLPLLAQVILDDDTSPGDRARFIRALDFIPGDKNATLFSLLVSNDSFVSGEALGRLKGFRPEKPEHKKVVARLLARSEGTETYVDLIRRFGLEHDNQEMLDLVEKHEADSLGASAARLLLERGESKLLASVLRGEDAKKAVKTARALGNANDQRAVPLLASLAVDDTIELSIVGQSVRSLARTRRGAETVLKLAVQKKLPEEILPVAGIALSNVPWRDLKQRAEKIIPPPPSRDNKPLPPISQLVRMRGDAGRGVKVFDTACATCHKSRDRGKDFGPGLAEIGDKLPREALFLSILDPNAGISFDYVGTQLTLQGGDAVVGIVVSETGDSLTLKQQDAIVTKYKKSDILGREKTTTSIMPTDLQRTMTVQELVDLVDYLSKLRK